MWRHFTILGLHTAVSESFPQHLILWRSLAQLLAVLKESKTQNPGKYLRSELKNQFPVYVFKANEVSVTMNCCILEQHKDEQTELMTIQYEDSTAFKYKINTAAELTS